MVERKAPGLQQASRTKSEAGERSSGKREAILGAAIELFLEVGYGPASINALVRRIGGSKATVYAYFKNKEKLFEAVVNEVLREVSQSMSALDLQGLELRQGLTLAGRQLLRLVTSKRHVGLARLVFAEARRFPEVGRIYYDRGPSLAYEGLATFLGDHKRNGTININDEEEAANWFTSMLLHQSFMERLCVRENPPSPAEIGRNVDRVLNVFLKIYARPGIGSGKE